MSRILASISLAMLVLTLAMGVKTFATAHGDGSMLVAKNGPAPPPAPWNGPAPPPAPWK
jgi:hypothetical protein